MTATRAPTAPTITEISSRYIDELAAADPVRAVRR